MDDLVLAMPSREFIALRGLTTAISMAVLDSLQEDSWFALPSALHQDPLAVEVHIGRVLVRPGEALLTEAGSLVTRGPVPPEAFATAQGLAGLKRHVLGLNGGGRTELVGYLYEPVQLPRVFLLLYRCQGVTGAGSWVPSASLAGLVKDPIDRLALPLVPR
jgi:hypothetical protein